MKNNKREAIFGKPASYYKNSRMLRRKHDREYRELMAKYRSEGWTSKFERVAYSAYDAALSMKMYAHQMAAYAHMFKKMKGVSWAKLK